MVFAREPRARVWDRAVKGYESMRVVYEIRNQISDWNQQQAAEEEAAAEAKANSRKLPAATGRDRSRSAGNQTGASQHRQKTVMN